LSFMWYLLAFIRIIQQFVDIRIAGSQCRFGKIAPKSESAVSNSYCIALIGNRSKI